MFASIIIPVFKRTEWLGKCLESLYNQDFEEAFEIIVVDDGSPNSFEIVAIAERFKAEKSRVPLKYFRKTNGGPAAARNFGVLASQGEILCFIDDDSVPAPDWLRQLTRPFVTGAPPAVISGRTCSYDRLSPLPLLLERTVYAGKTWATCNIAYHRIVYEALDGFDETFPEPSWEDNDLGLRARWKGYPHIYCDQAVVYHPHEGSLAEYREKCVLNGRGAAIFSRKYLFTKPFWSIAAPLLMSRRLLFGLFYLLDHSKQMSEGYVKFLWSYHSLQGFMDTVLRKMYGKNETR